MGSRPTSGWLQNRLMRDARLRPRARPALHSCGPHFGMAFSFDLRWHIREESRRRPRLFSLCKMLRPRRVVGAQAAVQGGRPGAGRRPALRPDTGFYNMIILELVAMPLLHS